MGRLVVYDLCPRLYRNYQIGMKNLSQCPYIFMALRLLHDDVTTPSEMLHLRQTSSTIRME